MDRKMIFVNKLTVPFFLSLGAWGLEFALNNARFFPFYI